MNEAAQKSLTRGFDWLLAQQAADGGWHSQTYGQLKDGAAVTALGLYALSYVPQNLRSKHAAAIDKGYAFLARGLTKRGTIASPDGSLDFPTYACALWLSSRLRLKLQTLPDERRQVIDYLLGAQVVEGRGFAPDSPSYGGWDFLGPGDAQGITTGTNISVTRYVVESLRANLLDIERTNFSGGAIQIRGPLNALLLGKSYVARCQQPDGGSAFTCEPKSLNNKAAYADDELTQPRSYGTATCDGILGLLACGTKPDDERIVKAVTWLAKRPSLELVPGFDGLPPEAGWQRGLRYYYYAALAGVLPLLPASEVAPRREALVKHLIGLQKTDGQWVNESDRMRENDPLIATALAVVALALLH